MSNLVFEILLRLAKAGVALVLGLILYGVLVGVLGNDRLRRAGAAVLAERRRLHPARGDEPDLSSFDSPSGGPYHSPSCRLQGGRPGSVEGDLPTHRPGLTPRA